MKMAMRSQGGFVHFELLFKRKEVCTFAVLVEKSRLDLVVLLFGLCTWYWFDVDQTKLLNQGS